MTDEPDHPPGDRGLASLHLPVSETRGSHLAHWPPPQRGREVKSVAVKHHAAEHHAAEPVEHAKPHGWCLTRSHFKEDDDG